ncbi:MAG: hypothetical protein HOC21_00135, partial [Phycisphaerae bacterium]|nr:hypothetical protein [Phycisphaerae bacterium]
MISRTLLITSIACLCMVIAGTAKKPVAHTGQDPVIGHTGQDPVRAMGEAGFTSTRLITGLARPVQVVAAPNDY